jgi:FtsZ-binding cell division protein ZapB
MDDCEVFIKYNYWPAWKVYDTEETLEKKIRKVLDNINCIDAYVLEIHDLKEFEIGLVNNRFNIKTAHDIFDLINILKVWP